MQSFIRKLSFLVLALMAWQPQILASMTPPNAVPMTRTCLIQIRETHQNGERNKKQFQTLLRSQSECYQLARIHHYALVPHTVKARSVAYFYGKPPREIVATKKKAFDTKSATAFLNRVSLKKARAAAARPVIRKFVANRKR